MLYISYTPQTVPLIIEYKALIMRFVWSMKYTCMLDMYYHGDSGYISTHTTLLVKDIASGLRDSCVAIEHTA